MSDVRLSNGSPTLERTEARQAEPPKPSACRNLFGPVDHDALARELRRHRRELEEASRRRWNFDFQRHRPLQGRYEWRAVGEDALPDFYGRPPARAEPVSRPTPSGGLAVRAARPRRPRSQGTARQEDAAAAAPRDSAGHGAAQRKRPASDAPPLLDAAPRSKRGAAAAAEEAAPQGCPDAGAAEQTPEKRSPGRRRT